MFIFFRFLFIQRKKATEAFGSVYFVINVLNWLNSLFSMKKEEDTWKTSSKFEKKVGKTAFNSQCIFFILSSNG